MNSIIFSKFSVNYLNSFANSAFFVKIIFLKLDFGMVLAPISLCQKHKAYEKVNIYSYGDYVVNSIL